MKKSVNPDSYWIIKEQYTNYLCTVVSLFLFCSEYCMTLLMADLAAWRVCEDCNLFSFSNSFYSKNFSKNKFDIKYHFALFFKANFKIILSISQKTVQICYPPYPSNESDGLFKYYLSTAIQIGKMLASSINTHKKFTKPLSFLGILSISCSFFSSERHRYELIDGVSYYLILELEK